MKKIDFTMYFIVMHQSLDRVFKDMLAFQKEHLQELFVCNDTVTIKLLTERRNIKNGMVNLKGKSYPVIKTSKNYNHNYKDKYVEFPLPLTDLALMKDFALTSEEVRHVPEIFDLNWLNVSYKEWHKYEDKHHPIEKRHGLFKLDLLPRADGSVVSGHYFLMNESDIDKALIKEWIFFYLDKYLPHCRFRGINRFYPSRVRPFSLYKKRMALEWFSFLPAEILPEEVPSANEVIYLPNRGSIIISTEQPYDFENPEMRKVAAVIEQELHHLGLLPIVNHVGIPQISDLPFISREQRLKNMSRGSGI
ncbi:Imm52 family immunity protein [Neisseria sp. HMSC068C04]|uniref:Imm52 family immunity protein n=1 Tax=Neisseria sp. HMSC068C04 TaxID=1715179 RepID=UPI0008A2DCBB|nr:Imm52 family immunity protein [Neisseria sp. HMSC068C04]OFM34671.1 hypothetical protein HMPREF2700_06785 [Neisseria sp. HMSC068C04]